MIATQVKTFAPGERLAPGVAAVPLPGHTPGHSGYEITSGAARLIDIGDTAHSSIISLARPQWGIAYDHDQALGSATRQAELARLAASHELVFAPHFPFPGVGRIEAAGHGYAWTPGAAVGRDPRRPHDPTPSPGPCRWPVRRYRPARGRLRTRHPGGCAALRRRARRRPYGSQPIAPCAPACRRRNSTEKLAALLGWMDGSLHQSGQLYLLPDDPDGITAGGRTNARMQTLKQTYWLQDNALYGAGALEEYEPAEGRQLSATWRRLWGQHFPQLCPDTQSGYVVGIVPAYDGGPPSSDPNCRLPRPADWQFFRMHQYPSPASDAFDNLPKPIIGADHPVDEQSQTHLAPIEATNVRDLLKYGCLRQVALGHHATAQQMFDLALAQWDGAGFINTKNAAGGRLARDLLDARPRLRAGLRQRPLASGTHPPGATA